LVSLSPLAGGDPGLGRPVLRDVECVIRELRDLPVQFEALRTQEAYASLGKLLNLNAIDNEGSLLEFLETEREKIESFFGLSSVNEQATSELFASNAGRRIRPFFDRLARTLLVVFKSVLSSEARVFYLLDQFEQCSPKQQETIAKLLATAGSSTPFFAKIGCRPYKSLALSRIAPQDYRVVQLEMAPDSPEYARFAREVISLRIKSIAAQLQIAKMPENYISLFSNVEALLGVHSFASQWSAFSRKIPRGKPSPPVAENQEVSAFRALTLNKLPKLYAGLPTIRRLSGGFVRNLLSFVYQAFRLSLEEYEHRTLRKLHLPPDAQNKACRAEAQNELGVRLRAILSSSGRDLSAPLSETRKEQVEALLRWRFLGRSPAPYALSARWPLAGE
jgi:hypothetical protein